MLIRVFQHRTTITTGTIATGPNTYCTCGPVMAGINTETKSGTVYGVCAGTPYPTITTIGPVSKKSPGPTSPTSEGAAATATQQCNVHLWEGEGQQIGEKDVYLDVNVTDSKGKTLGYGHNGFSWGDSLVVDSGLRAGPLTVIPQRGDAGAKAKRWDINPRQYRQRGFDGRVELARRSEIPAETANPLPKPTVQQKLAAPIPPRPVYEKGTVGFVLGTQTWDSSQKACTTGAWDNGNANDFFGSLIFGDEFIPVRCLSSFASPK